MSRRAILRGSYRSGDKPMNLAGLNPQQHDAVLATEGPVLVLAGAGSGKTRVITYRIGSLLERGVMPGRILALSFTNKAAGEMRERVRDLVGRAGRDTVLCTFHALGVRFLREEAESVGLSRGFSILDEGDQRDAIRQALLSAGFNLERYEPRMVHARLSHYKGRLEKPDQKLGPLDAAVHHAWPLYEQRLRAMNAVDFDDLVTLPVIAMEGNPGVAERWGARFRYVMVDEYQDTNSAQLRMVKALCRQHANVCVVGDDDQSIYAWRGAVAGNILSFDEHFPGARTIALTQNYRSTNTVLRAANAVISNNAERHEKSLWSENGDGPPLRYFLADNDEEEAHFIATDLLGTRNAERLKWQEFAVLYRTNAQSRALEAALRGAGIPYRIVGGTRFYDRKEVRDLVAYLRVCANPFDEAAFRRIVNYPNRGVGDLSIQRVGEHAKSAGKAFWQAVRAPDEVVGLQPRTANALKKLDADLETFRRRFRDEPLAPVCRDVIEYFSFADAVVRDGQRDPRQVRRRLDNLEEVASALAAFQRHTPEGTLVDYLAKLSLDTRKENDGDEETDEVCLMTLHGAKGLEFTAVYLAGCEEGLMPHKRVLEGDGDLAEERRLAYVGITRARVHLTLTGARQRLRYGKVERRRPSRFIEEIPPELFAGGRSGKLPLLSVEEKDQKAKSAFDEILGL